MYSTVSSVSGCSMVLKCLTVSRYLALFEGLEVLDDFETSNGLEVLTRVAHLGMYYQLLPDGLADPL